MAMLYLIRHPLTHPDPDLPASVWRLSDIGREQVEDLVAAPFWANVHTVYTSPQYKAAVVGETAAAAYSIPHIVIPDLTEAHRDRWLGRDAFQAAQQDFFARPATSPVEGWESAQSARARFVAAMQDVLARHAPDESLAVVAHATVLALYVARLQNEPPTFDYWRTIGFAAVMAVARESLQPVTPFLVAPYEGLPS